MKLTTSIENKWLIEHAFYDNQADLNLLQNNRADFVEADCKAICKYFNIAYKSPTNKPVEKPVAPSKPVTNVNVPSKTKPFKNGDYDVKAKVTASSLNVRKGRPGQSGYNTIIGQLKKGEIVTVGYCLNGWFGVVFNGQQAFISGDYVELVL